MERQNMNVNDVDYMNNSSLHYAAATGDALLLVYLLDRNAQIFISSTGNSPLHEVRILFQLNFLSFY